MIRCCCFCFCFLFLFEGGGGCYVCRLFLAIFGGVVRQVSDGSHSVQVSPNRCIGRCWVQSLCVWECE